MRHRTIGWAPRDYHHDHDLAWSEAEAIEELRPLLQQGYRLRVVVQSTAPNGDDRPSAERIRRALDAELVIPATIREAAEAYAGCELVICQRMHAAIFALQAGCKVLVVSHEPKMDGLMADFDLSDSIVTTSKGLGDEVRRRMLPVVTDDLLASLGPYD